VIHSDEAKQSWTTSAESTFCAVARSFEQFSDVTTTVGLERKIILRLVLLFPHVD
jgi:hypothetical protein